MSEVQAIGTIIGSLIEWIVVLGLIGGGLITLGMGVETWLKSGKR